MANDKLQIQISAEDKASADLKKLQGELDKFKDQAEKTGTALEKSARSNESFTKSIIKADLAVAALRRGLGFIVDQYRESTQLANEYQKSVVGLSSTAAAFGESQDSARAAVQRLTKDGLLSFADASKSLQNLLTTGIGLDKAEQLMNAYKNQAALGRAANIGFSQAVANLSESFLTESSAIGNLSGQSENYNQIIERGAAILGKNVASLTDAERQQAKFLGTMELGKVVAGDLALYLGTADAQTQIFNNTIDKLQIQIGQALSPAIMFAVQGLSQFALAADGQASPALQNIAKGFVTAVGGMKVFASAIYNLGALVVDFAKQTGDVFSKLFKGDIIGAGEAASLGKTFDNIKNRFNSFVTDIDKTKQSVDSINLKIDKQGLGSFGNVFKDKAQFAAQEVAKAGQDIADKLKKIGADIGKELENYARSAGDKIRAFQDSMRDLVIKHRNAIQDLRAQIEGLNADFADASKERSEAHGERRSEIVAKYEEETKNLKDNLARRLTDTKGSDQQLIAFFQAQIAEKERLRDEELRKEDEKFAKDEAKQQASFAKQLNALQAKLNAELDIQRKHQAEFDKFRDAVEDDDITRLQQSFEREMAELKRQHEERMAELRREQNEIAILKGIPANTKATATLKKYHDGGMIPGNGEVPILAKGGETVLTQQQTHGLMDLLKQIGAGMTPAVAPSVAMTNNIYNQVDLIGAMREMGWRTRIR